MDLQLSVMVYFFTYVYMFLFVYVHMHAGVYVCVHIGGQDTIPDVVHPVLSVFFKDNLSLAS